MRNDRTLVIFFFGTKRCQSVNWIELRKRLPRVYNTGVEHKPVSYTTHSTFHISTTGGFIHGEYASELGRGPSQSTTIR